MDEMLARAVLEDHGHFRFEMAHYPSNTGPANSRSSMDRFITIPGIETLSEPEQIALAKKAEYGPRQSRLDA